MYRVEVIAPVWVTTLTAAIVADKALDLVNRRVDLFVSHFVIRFQRQNESASTPT